MWVTLDNGLHTVVRWIERPYIDDNSGIIKIKLDELMRPYLLGLKDRFTAYNIYYTLAMRSKYALRIYEILKSYENLGEWTFDIEELKKTLCIEKYSMYKDFRVKVIDVALKEINELTDISVTYQVEKKGKKIDRIILKMKSKKDIKDIIETYKKIEQKLSPKQMDNIFVSQDGKEPIIDAITKNLDKREIK
jgi:plasmid replication initiation protein